MTPENFTGKLRSVMDEMGLDVAAERIEKLYRHHQMIYKENRTNRLTAIAEEDAPLLNVADSLSALMYLRDTRAVCDIGSGAGYPGLALAVVLPETRFTLLDSLKKRVDFLNRVIWETRLENARAVHIRAEDAGRSPEFRERFDAVVARALAALPVLCEYALPLLGMGGRMIAYKGRETLRESAEAEKALELLGGSGNEAVPAGVPGRAHMLWTARKTGPTPERYPRKAGKPEKSPLK